MGREDNHCVECDKLISRYRDSEYCSRKCEKQVEAREQEANRALEEQDNRE